MSSALGRETLDGNVSAPLANCGKPVAVPGNSRDLSCCTEADRAIDVPERRPPIRLRSAPAGQVCYDRVVPHKNLWQLKDDEGAELACELEAMSANRVLLIVKRNGEPIVQETFADKRDALARSVGLHKEMSGKTRPADTPPPDQTS
jgi:hypothetical protein